MRSVERPDHSPFTIHHWDTFDNATIEIGWANTLAEAEAFVEEKYKGRICPNGADQVDIVNANRDIVKKFKVR